MANLSVTIMGIASKKGGEGIEVRNDVPREVLQLSFEPGENLTAIFKRMGNSRIGELGTFLRLKGGRRVDRDYVPTDGDEIEQFVPYPF